MEMMTRICFCCHGNICRSVSAEYILQEMVNQAHVADTFFIDSAATSMEEIGNSIYPPMERALRKKGIPIGNHRARQLRRSDYGKFDLIIGMDEENMYYMHRILGDDLENKIHYLMEYTDRPNHKIDDPWYTREFDLCAEEITEGCRGLLEHIRNHYGLNGFG